MERKRSKILIFAVLMFFLLSSVISAEAKEKASLHEKLPSKTKKLTDEEILKILFAKDNYRYNPANKPDPFKPFLVKEESAPKKYLSPLQMLDLNAIRLVGITDTPQGKLAIIQDSTGRGYFVRVGSKIGSSGVVVKIDNNALYIQEEVKDFLGRVKKQEIVLKLRPAED